MSDDIETPEDAFDTEDAEDAEVTAFSDEETDLDLEAPEADAVEQQIELLQARDLPITERPDEADPADAAEQRRVVQLDEDDYR